MNEWATGGTFKELTKGRFCEIEIPLPAINIQREIVSEIEDLQKENVKLKGKIEFNQQIIKNKIASVWGE